MKHIPLLIIILMLFSCKEKKETVVNITTKEKKVSKLELDYAINKQYEIGDVRRYGVMPNIGIGQHPISKKNSIETVLDLAEKEAIEMTFPKGYYKDGLYIKGRKNITLNFHEAEFGGPIFILENEKQERSSGIVFKGHLITYFKLFTRYSDDITINDLTIKSDIEKNISNLRSMGCDIYAGTKSAYINNLVIEDLGSEKDKDDSFKRIRAAVQVHGWNENPEDIIIEKIHIKSSDRHGVYLTGRNHIINEIVIDKFGIGNTKDIQDIDDSDISKKETSLITGLWLNKCDNTTIGSVIINTKESKGKYALWLDSGDIGKPTIIESLVLKGGDEKLPIYAEDITNVVVKSVEK